MADSTKLSPCKPHRPACCRVTIGILLFTTSSFASANDTLQGIIDKYSAEFMGDAIARHTIVADSESNVDQIPSPYLYRAAFLRLILNAEDTRRNFSNSDWNIIMTLPDHNDSRFQANNLATLQSNCAQMQNLRPGGYMQAARNKAVLASEAERSLLRDLEHHYSTVISSFSDNGRAQVEAELEGLSEVANMTWTNVDLIGLSAEIPEYVEFVVSQSCEQIIAAPPPTPERRLLKDAPDNWALMEAE